MGLICIKYAVGVALALHPALARELTFALACSAMYGAFCGVFAARAARLWRWALRQDNGDSSTVLRTAN